jgi:hypothetical protein
VGFGIGFPGSIGVHELGLHTQVCWLHINAPVFWLSWGMANQAQIVEISS